MQPIAPLMIEHRLIDKVIAKIEARLSGPSIPVEVVLSVVDFFRTYADACHHGKEEDILFKALETKALKSEDKKLMHELLDEHKNGRAVVKKVLDSVATPAAALKELIGLYPQHIKKEDKVFFIASMNYFDAGEQAKMLTEMNEFDRNFIHDVYKQKVERL